MNLNNKNSNSETERYSDIQDTKDIKIKTDYIKLSSFLKLIGEAETGGMASNMVTGGEILVNGEACLMRGKKLRNGDVCRVNGKNYRVIQGVFERNIV